MTLKDWVENRKEEQLANRPQDTNIDDSIGKLWTKCVCCSEQLLKKDLIANNNVCPKCDYHFRLPARNRIAMLIDDGSFEELFQNIRTTNPLNFSDTETYESRIEKAIEQTGLDEAVVTGTGKINGNDVCIGVMDFDFMGGSMGSVVGEKITRLFEYAIEHKMPVIAVTASGGARMQEGILSLMQMAKTSCAVSKLNEAGILYITVLTEPTFGGVTASFATIGDIIIAEQGARIGFAGRRVIEQTIHQKLPADFQTAEYLMKYGQIDMIAKRSELKDLLTKLLIIHKG